MLAAGNHRLLQVLAVHAAGNDHARHVHDDQQHGEVGE